MTLPQSLGETVVIPWKCAGCGIPTPMLVERCACPTGVVYAREPHRSACKLRGPIGMMAMAYVASRAAITKAGGQS